MVGVTAYSMAVTASFVSTGAEGRVHGTRGKLITQHVRPIGKILFLCQGPRERSLSALQLKELWLTVLMAKTWWNSHKVFSEPFTNIRWTATQSAPKTEGTRKGEGLQMARRAQGFPKRAPGRLQ